MDIHLLRRLVDYDPETGALTFREAWPEMFGESPARSREYRKNTWNSQFAGRPAFASDHGTGYLAGKLLGRTFKAHRVAWAIFYGEIPAGEVDHLNGNRSDNRIANLRVVTKAENQRNAKRRADNTSGKTGVSWCERDAAWVVQVQSDGRRLRRNFKAREDALAYRSELERSLGFSDRHGTTSRSD
jgi:hypothetical protein